MLTEEEKQLLLKDLCTRLPYGVKIYREWIAPMSGSPENSIMELDTFDIEVIKTSIELGEEGNYRDGKMQGLTICDDGKNHFVRGYMCKPYLRSMSNMTEEECKEFCKISGLFKKEDGNFSNHLSSEWGNTIITERVMVRTIDWLNAHHFDYRGLITMGLALEAKEGMYK